MNFHQDFHSECAGLCSKHGNEAESFRNHETTCSMLLDGVADCVKPNHAYASRSKSFQNCGQISPTLRMLYGDIDLVRGKGGPKESPLP
jgi:hypothetical protein